MIDWLTAYGLFAVTAMLLCYALEDRSPWFVLAFAAACLLGSLYGFLQGAWPFGVVEAIWAIVAFRRWWNKDPALPVAAAAPRPGDPQAHGVPHAALLEAERHEG